MLTIALCLVSCSTQKQVTRHEEERTVNKDIQTQLDSLVRSIAETQFERLINTIEQVDTDIILYDTDKPVNDSTGLPPVKAVVNQKVKREDVKAETVLQQVQTETEVEKQVIDKTVEDILLSVEAEEKPSWWETFKQHLMRIALIPVIFLALWILYKLIKLLL